MKKKVEKNKESVGVEESRGLQLKKLREAKAMSLKDVSLKTKIHIKVLKDLEEDHSSHMSLTYVKGLLKIYCGFLGVDYRNFIDEDVKEETKKIPLSDFSKAVPASKVIPDTKTEAELVKPYVNISMIRKGLKFKIIIFAAVIFVLGIGIFKLAKKMLSYRELHSVKPSPEDAILKPEVVVPSNPADRVTESMPVLSSIVGNPKLGIRAKEDCWLEVKADGKTIFKNVLKKGYFEFWEAQKKIEFSVGNAGGLDVEVNGKILPPLGRRGQVIKNITVTSDGLKVLE